MTADVLHYSGGKIRRASGLEVPIEAVADEVSSVEDVRDAGRWEVAVHLTPAVAVLTPDETDWVYGWVTG